MATQTVESAGMENDIIDVESKATAAMGIVKRNMIWSAGVGFLPIPLVELVAITAVQVKLIKELSDHYDVPFSADLARSSVVSLLSSLGGMAISKVLAASLLRVVPVLGQVAAAVTLPVVSAGVSYAIGRVFISHFEMGGTLLDFDPEAVRDHFKSEFQDGVKQAAAQKKNAK